MVGFPQRGARLWRRAAAWAGGVLVVLVALCATLVFAFLHTFYPSAPAAHFAPDGSVAQSQTQDLDYFKYYLDYNRTYSPSARAEAARLLENYAARAGRMSDAQFDLAVARMTALADNGHSRVYPDVLRQRHNHLPCLLYHFSDGYYVVRARGACQALLGAKLLAIDGLPIADVADKMYAYLLGPRTHYDQFYSPFFLESPELLHAAGLTREADHVVVRVALEGGAQQDVSLVADPPDPKWLGRGYSNTYLSAEPSVPDGNGWTSVLPEGTPLPFFLKDFNEPFRLARWPGIFYAQFRSNMSENGHPIGAFVAAVEKAIKAERPPVVVIDLRFDQGGDFTTTSGLMSRLAHLIPTLQRIYVLTSGWTFSAGITSVGLAKEHGAGKVLVLGEPVGDRMRFWGEGRDMVLPNSHLKLHYATGLHDYSQPCWGQKGCFWTTFSIPMHLKTLAPDVVVPYTFAEYRAGQDPVMAYVFATARGALNKAAPPRE